MHKIDTTYCQPANLIPHFWHYKIVDKEGRPDLPCIMILAEILGWYRSLTASKTSYCHGKSLPELVDGSLVISYEYLTNKLNLHKERIRRKLVRLESLGILTRTVRNISSEDYANNINRILRERGWKLQDLERKAGTNRTIYNIMRESSNNPSLDLLEKIAKALNVDYKELINDHSNIQYINDYTLLLDACTKVIAELKLLPPNLKISFDAVCILILEVYSYADQFKNSTIDIQFVKWSVMKYYSLDQSTTN